MDERGGKKTTIRMKKKADLTEATRKWLAANVKCYDTDYHNLPHAYFEYDREGKIFYSERVEGKIFYSERVVEIVIKGNCKDFKDSDGKLIKFSNVEGLFTIVDCQFLTNLDGAPDEVYTNPWDYEGASEITIKNCPALKKWKKEYISGGAENITIEFCKNLENVTLTGSFSNVFISDLPRLKKFTMEKPGYADTLDNDSDLEGTSIYLSTCKSIEIESIDLPEAKFKVSIDNCEKIMFELEEADITEFQSLKRSKNLQRGKNLGLF